MNFSFLAAAVLANGVLLGLIPAVVDGLKTPLKARLNLADERTEWFARLFYIVWLPAMPLAGWLLDFLPNREILFFGSIALILGVAWLALVRSAATLLWSTSFLGAAYSVVTMGTVRLMTVAFFSPADIAAYSLNIASLNIGFMAVGVGAILGPWIAHAIDRSGGPRQGLLCLAIAMIVPAGLTALCDRHGFPPPETVASWDTTVGQLSMALVIVVILIYFALENCLEFWPSAYLREIGYQGGGKQITLFVFWLAFIATRGAAAWWLYEHPSHGFHLPLILFGASAILLGIVAEGYDLGSGTVWFWLLGACYGPILPGLIGMALDLPLKRDPPALLSNGVLGVLLALSGFDTLAVRPLMGYVTKKSFTRQTMLVPTLLAIVAAGILVVLAFVR